MTTRTETRAGDGLIIIDHTEVPGALRGRKIAERRVRQAIEDARREGIAIIPLCPFAKAQIGRHPEWRDVFRRSSAATNPSCRAWPSGSRQASPKREARQ